MDQTLSQLLGLPQPTVTSVLEKLDSGDSNAQQFLTSIQQKLEQSVGYTDGDETFKEKARLQYENTRLENELHRLNKNIGQVKSQLEGAKSEVMSRAEELKELQSKTSKLQSLLDDERNQRAALETQLTQQQQQLTALQDEKRNHLSQIAERREQLDDKDREISRMTEIIQDLRAQASQDHEQLARLRAQTSVSDVNEHMLKQSLELAKNQVKWLDEELVKTQTEMQQAKTELSRSSTTGRAETARLRAEIESLNEQIEEARHRSGQTDRTLRAKMEAERMAKAELAERTEQFKSEMAAQKKLCAEWERTTEAAKEHVRGVEASLRELESHQKANEEEAGKAVSLMEQRLEEVEQAYGEARESAAKLEAELRNANRLLAEAASSGSSTQGKLMLSPTASVASQVQSAQKSLNITQLYSEKVALEDRLKSADSEIDCLRQSMEQILSEIEERGPIIAAEREEYHRLLEDADRIAKDLAEVRQDSVAKDKSLKESLRERELLQRQVAMEKQQTRDLERQVAGLLRAAEETRTGGRSVPERPDSSRSSFGATDSHLSSDEEEKWLNDVDRVISQKLVAFSDITDLVAQNRRLLRTTRELAAQVAQEEELQREANEDQVKDALEQAEALLDQLSTEFDDAKRRLGVVERERDMLKTIKGQRGGGDDDIASTPVVASLEQQPSTFGSSFGRQSTDGAAHATVKDDGAGVDGSPALQLAQLQEDFDIYKNETRKTRTQLERDATKMQTELSELRVRSAKAESQNQFDSDRIQMFTRDLEARQKEVDHLRLATSRLHKQAESYEKQLDSTTQSMTADRVELSKLRRQTAVLEAERDNLAANEKRWRSEEQRLITERASLTQILENTTKMRDEWQRSSEQQVAQVRERLEAARKETDDVRVELRQAREANERAQFKNDAELRELRGQIDQRETRVSQMREQMLESKEAYAKLQGEKREVEVSRDALQRQIAVLEARIQSQETLMQRAKGQGQSVSKESLLTVQLQDARSQIESLQSELATTSKRAEDYRQLSSTNESSLDELTRTYDQYKAEQERVTAEQKTRVERLESSLHEAQASLASCQSELEAARQAAQTAETALETQKSEIASRLTQLEDAVEQKTQSLATLRDDMRRHEESAQSLQEQYEREIVAHAKDIEGTLLAREKLRETQRKLTETADELQACEKANARLKQDDRKARDKADQDVKAAEEQLSEIRRQNSLLLAHLESLGHQVPDISVDPEQVASVEGGDAANDAGEQPSSVPSAPSGLRDVVVYLRRERDLVTAQLELAQQESQRWKQQTTHTQRMLDEARNELMQYTPAGVGSGGIADNDGDTSMGQHQSSSSSSVETILAAGEGPLSLTASQRQSCRQLIEQATLLRESNTVLRSELNGARAQLHSLETELTKVKDQEVPQLRSINASLQAELDAVRAEVQQLQHMCEHWKQRHEKVLARYQMIEPEEYEALKKQNEELRAAAERMTVENARLQEQNNREATQKVTADSRKAKLLQSEISRLKSQVDSLMNDLSSERGILASTQEESQRMARDAQEQKAKFDKLHTVFQKLRQQSVEKLDQSNKTIKAHEATIQSLSQQIDELRGHLEAGAEQQLPVLAPSVSPQQGSGAQDDAVAKLQSEITVLTKDKDDATTAQHQLAEQLQQTQQLLENARAELVTAQNTTGEAAGADASIEVEQLRQKLAEADAKVKDYESQLEQLKARALKYARDNKVLQAKATQLEKQVAELQQTQQGEGASPSSSLVNDLQKQLSEAQKQLAGSEAKIEAAQANAKKTAELRSKLQISRANKRAADLETQVNELQEKIVALESSTGGTVPLKRPTDSEDTPAKKQHIEENETAS
ncbi:Filament-forming protein [Coemansia sp. RSA 1813]|nr:Protein mlp1 [Coemansia sp. RSA 1646]KAJ1771854.1 Filament-forming protein [Coemansia sp. RSA 1843]KAJ2216065.1 Filament-forming protein [Coemansia sp. RSA 487]KAJ2570482.1 Filament-forming protein [Coemansia sp. RSA 1813]